jgi:FHS family L-fucose permease-like MFS transporter
MIFYLSEPGGVLGSVAIAGTIAALYWLLMLVGRFAGSFISGKVSSRTQLIVVSAVAMALIMVAILIPESKTFNLPGSEASPVDLVLFKFTGGTIPVKCLFLILCGLCTSVMWGGIFNLATEGLGKYTASASGLFMTMVVGGGVMPLIQNLMARSVGDINSYWLVVAMLSFLLFYGLVGCKNKKSAAE